GILSVLNDKVIQQKTPILGICLGMQLLSCRSEEGVLPGLGWIDAETIRFRFPVDKPQLRLPHMGWNTIQVSRASPILDDRFDKSRFYFVHSYHVRCRHDETVLAVTDYGIEFHSAIMHENIIGTQFHPEKSHKFGVRLLQNFARM